MSPPASMRNTTKTVEFPIPAFYGIVGAIFIAIHTKSVWKYRSHPLPRVIAVQLADIELNIRRLQKKRGSKFSLYVLMKSNKI